jgi:hypothetical protein
MRKTGDSNGQRPFLLALVRGVVTSGHAVTEYCAAFSAITKSRFTLG